VVVVEKEDSYQAPSLSDFMAASDPVEQNFHQAEPSD
jgi:hypothetical protein